MAPPAGLVLALVSVAVLEGGTGNTQPRRSSPRLVVVFSLDQMRSDYIESYSHQWTGGLKRLVTDGARLMAAAYPYLNTVTCPGHATISTGTFPRTHGMILNSWWDRERSRILDCMSDSDAVALPYNKPGLATPGFSPRDLLVPTFADELRAQLGKAPRILSVAVKARSAIALAGRKGDVVLWVDRGGLTTSTAYTASRVAFVEEFVKRHALDAELRQDWTRILPPELYAHSDDGAGERPPREWTATFPHAIGTLSDAERRIPLWTSSPLVDEYLGRLVGAAITALQLGRRDTTDLLAMSFSSLDSVGHAFGPRSHEVQDALARIDRILGRLLETLDEAVGRDNYVVALSADHGVSPIPEQMAQQGLSAGRVLSGDIRAVIDRTLAKRFGSGQYVISVNYTDVYFAPGVYDRVQADPSIWTDLAAAVRAIPGIERAFRREDLIATTSTDDPTLQAARLSYSPGRSGDMVVVPRSYWIMSTAAATHGTHYAYDKRVPVVFYGRGVRAGQYWQPATPADIAPTLAALAGVTMAAAEGRVLSEAFSGVDMPSKERKPAP